jgi:hypothetical protein
MGWPWRAKRAAVRRVKDVEIGVHGLGREMPTPQHHLGNLLQGMIATTGDRVSFVVAGFVGSAPFWRSRMQETADWFVIIGPVLAGVFVISKIVLTWIQIWKTARSEVKAE